MDRSVGVCGMEFNCLNQALNKITKKQTDTFYFIFLKVMILKPKQDLHFQNSVASSMFIHNST